MNQSKDTKKKTTQDPAGKMERWRRFGKWVREHRERMYPRVTQTEAAARADVTRVTWAYIEGGHTGSSQNIIRRVAHVLEVSEDEALVQAGFAPDMDFSRIAMPLAYLELQTLPEEIQQSVFAHIRTLKQAYEEKQESESNDSAIQSVKPRTAKKK
jgi:transcriptional regulator with XRE-family HTH domain